MTQINLEPIGEDFTVVFPDGETLTLPNIGNLTIPQITALSTASGKSEQDVINAFLDTLPQEIGDRLKACGIGYINQIFKAWFADLNKKKAEG